jgi:hypothetical protein
VSIDNDEYFQLMMNNSWNIKGDANTYKKYDKGWAAEDTAPKKVDYRVPQQPVQRSGMPSGDNPLVTNAGHYQNRPTTASRANVSKAMYSAPPMAKEVEIQ